MFEHCAVTTFSHEGYRLYGRRFLQTFLAHWDIPVVAYYEGEEPDMRHPRLLWKNLDADLDRAAFMQKWSGPQYNASWQEPNSQSIRFCHKVFAVTRWWPEDCRWWLWFDADVEFLAPVNEDKLHDLTPEDKSLVFLGRKRPPYSECGFVGYKVGDPRVRAMLADMRRVYTTGELFTRPRNCWHDSATFDYCRKRAGIPKHEQWNMNPNPNELSPWKLTLLGQVSRHNKGLRKVKVYGGCTPDGGP